MYSINRKSNPKTPKRTIAYQQVISFEKKSDAIALIYIKEILKQNYIRKK